MAAWTSAARKATQFSRLSSPIPSSLIHHRGLASGGEHHGLQKVNFWQDPLSPSRWKEEQFVIVSLVGWKALVYGGYKYFTKDNEEKKDEQVRKSST